MSFPLVSAVFGPTGYRLATDKHLRHNARDATELSILGRLARWHQLRAWPTHTPHTPNRVGSQIQPRPCDAGRRDSWVVHPRAELTRRGWAAPAGLHSQRKRPRPAHGQSGSFRSRYLPTGRSRTEAGPSGRSKRGRGLGVQNQILSVGVMTNRGAAQRLRHTSFDKISRVVITGGRSERSRAVGPRIPDIGPVRSDALMSKPSLHCCLEAVDADSGHDRKGCHHLHSERKVADCTPEPVNRTGPRSVSFRMALVARNW